ncbi:MBG domain-containing protein, partial [Pedobacter chitinilyticus]|uniref:MBG domain-containing protein n=1 Tax=Pedobacter chitinilyticus TaxID=2233776 RepID=UPI0019697E59
TLTITANNVNKVYGQVLSGTAGSTAFTSTGLENGETIGSVTIAYGTGAAANAAVGAYTGSVTPSAATGGTFAIGNYSISYTTGNIVVGAKTLTITANNVNKVYGQVLAGTAGSTAFTSTGLENGETIGSVTLAYGTGAAANATVGTYTGSITPSAATGGTFAIGNYSISYTMGNIIVGAKTLTITANNVNKVYG